MFKMYLIYHNLRSCHGCFLNFSVNALSSRFSCCNAYSTNDSSTNTLKKGPANAIKDLFGFTYHQAYSFVRKYPELKNIAYARISRTGEHIKKLGIDQQDLKGYPQVLRLNPVVIENRSLILRESGFSKITLQNLVYFGSLIKKKITLLKSHGCIQESLDVSKNYLECLQASPQTYESIDKLLEAGEGDKTISVLRELVLGCYLQHRLDASEEEVKHIFSTYSRISNKSLLLIHETLKILMEELKFPKSYVKTHGFLFYAHPRQLRRLLENIPSLGGMPLRDFIYKFPIAATSNYETFSETLQILKRAGISEEAILEAPAVFTLSAQNVQKGLALLKSESVKPEIKALLSHPQMLKLVVHQESVNQRLNYIENFESASELKPVASLNLLCGSSKVFQRYMAGTGGANRGNDVVTYIMKTLQSECKTVEERSLVTPVSVRESLKRHAHWRNVPLAEIQSSLEMLLKLGFTCKEIMISLQIVLYSCSKVRTQLKRLSQEDFLSDSFSFDDGLKKSMVEEESTEKANSKDIQNEEIVVSPDVKQHALPLCLYLLEKDHHFTGDGIWYRQ